uniref:WD repeat-containing protein 44 n=2 Tax=Mesocestoides corti TaxID=53468 RepID=A0A5K3F7W9_MESCO
MNSDNEVYFDAPEELDEIEDSIDRCCMTPECDSRRNRIESLKKSARKFDQPSDIPPYPHFDSLEPSSSVAPILTSGTYDPVLSDRATTSSFRLLSRTFPEKSSFFPRSSLQSSGFLFNDDGDSSSNVRSRTTQPSCFSPPPYPPPKIVPALPFGRPSPMSSAPEVSLRRNHPNKDDYVKSWSLDAARYRPQVLLNEQRLSLLVSPRGPLPMEPLLDRSESSELGDVGADPLMHRTTTTTDTLQPSRATGQPAFEASQVSLPSTRQVKAAAATLPASTVNPMSLDYRTRTLSASSLQSGVDVEKLDSERGGAHRNPNKLSGIRRLQTAFRGAMNAVRSATKTKIFSQDEPSSDEDDEVIGNQGIRLRCSRKIKSHREFLQIKLVQKMDNDHIGAIWAMRSSPCGRLLATAGYDRNIRIWVLRQWHNHFRTMLQSTANQMHEGGEVPSNLNAPSQLPVDDLDIESLSMTSASLSTGRTDDGASSCSSSGVMDAAAGSVRSRGEVNPSDLVLGSGGNTEVRRSPFYHPQPLLVYRGHEGVVTELAWSKNLFLLSTGMDRQVRLWHISRSECLCAFSHNDTVPAIVFHPKDDRYFLSGSLDGKLRLWNIPDKKVRFWVDVPLPSSLPPPSFPSSDRGLSPEPKTIITCATFACDSTKVVVGSYDGRVMFFNTELTYITFIAVKSVSGRSQQCRVTAIEVDPTDSNKVLVTSNDSRVRLIDARDYHTLCKYRGFLNETSQIRASFSATGRYIISGSENCFFYIWRKQMDFLNVSRFSSSRKDRNNCWEAIKAHDAVVTVAVFLPNPDLLLDKRLRRWNSARRRAGVDHALRMKMASKVSTYWGEVIVSADCNGCIRVFKNRAPLATPLANAGNNREGS